VSGKKSIDVAIVMILCVNVTWNNTLTGLETKLYIRPSTQYLYTCKCFYLIDDLLISVTILFPAMIVGSRHV